MSEDKILTSRFMGWMTLVIIPIIGIVLAGYEIFFKAEVVIVKKDGHKNIQDLPQNMFKEASELQNKGEFEKAYNKYKDIADMFPKTDIAKSARKRKKELEKVLQKETEKSNKSKNIFSEASNLQNKGKLKEACIKYKNIIELFPKSNFANLAEGRLKKINTLIKNKIDSLKRKKKWNKLEKYMEKFSTIIVDIGKLRNEIEMAKSEEKILEYKKEAGKFTKDGNPDFGRIVDFYEDKLNSMPYKSAKENIRLELSKTYLEWGKYIYKNAKMMDATMEKKGILIKQWMPSITEKLNKSIELDPKKEKGMYGATASKIKEEISGL